MTRSAHKEDKMKNSLWRALSAAALSVALVSACGGPAVEPGSGPAATAEPTPTAEPSDSPTELPTEDPPTEDSPDNATFKDKYVYEDKFEVEVTKIVNGKFTHKEVEYSDGEKYGDPYTKFTIRVKNGSSGTVDLSGYASVFCGPDGEEAEKSYQLELDDGLDGKLLPGKSRSTTMAFLVPTKYRSDVVLEFTPDAEHESAVFAGSTL